MEEKWQVAKLTNKTKKVKESHFDYTKQKIKLYLYRYLFSNNEKLVTLCLSHTVLFILYMRRIVLQQHSTIDSALGKTNLQSKFYVPALLFKELNHGLH